MTDGTQFFIPQQEHRGIRETIDLLYVWTATYSAELRGHLVERIGPLQEPYMNFYRSFAALHTMTCCHKEMEPYKHISENIVSWVNTRNVNEQSSYKGLQLFDLWQSALFKAGLLSVRK